MKVLIIAFVFIFPSFYVIGQNWEKDTLKGHVKSIKNIVFTNLDTVHFTTKITKYDIEGNRIETNMGSEKSGFIDQRIAYEYNDKGSLINECYYKSNGKLFQKIAYNYDSNGKLIESRGYNKKGKSRAYQSYEYNNNGKLIKTILTIKIFGDKTFETTYKYDSNGNPTEICKYNNKGKIYLKEIYFDGLTKNEKNKYLKPSTFFEIIDRNNDPNNLVFNLRSIFLWSTYYIFENVNNNIIYWYGLPIEIERTVGGPLNLKYEYKIFYFFDDTGNWIIKVKINWATLVVNNLIMREIEYY